MGKRTRIGVVAGCFDVIHPGYVSLFSFAKEQCDYLAVLVHADPSEERPEKTRPVMNVAERARVLGAIRYVDEVLEYRTEKDLESLLLSLCARCPSDTDIVRILGDDYTDKDITGAAIMPILFHRRDTGWTATRFKEACCASLKGRNPCK